MKYEIAKKKGVKMTKLVNNILEKAVNRSEEKEDLIKNSFYEKVL